MNAMIVKVPKADVMSLKGMIEEGLHIFGRAMSVAERMCEGEMGERYGMGMRDDYDMGERYPMYPMENYGMRQGVRGMGRYSRY